jgi:hypothetical protein
LFSLIIVNTIRLGKRHGETIACLSAPSEKETETRLASLKAIVQSFWKDLAVSYGAKKEEIERMAPAFRAKE